MASAVIACWSKWTQTCCSVLNLYCCLSVCLQYTKAGLQTWIRQIHKDTILARIQNNNNNKSNSHGVWSSLLLLLFKLGREIDKDMFTHRGFIGMTSYVLRCKLRCEHPGSLDIILFMRVNSWGRKMSKTQQKHLSEQWIWRQHTSWIISLENTEGSSTILTWNVRVRACSGFTKCFTDYCLVRNALTSQYAERHRRHYVKERTEIKHKRNYGTTSMK